MSSVADENRTARFRTVMSFHSSNMEFWTEGVAEGSITREEIGKGGFGYDPVFRSKQTGKTFAEMTTEEKNKISHRGLAIEKMRELLMKKIK